jgi:mannose-6-phosphate isomerase-like protein (cupin superfamily)
VVEEHDDTGEGAGHHEEVYVVVTGHATFTVDGNEVDAPIGTCVFLADPEERRGRSRNRRRDDGPRDRRRSR